MYTKSERHENADDFIIWVSFDIACHSVAYQKTSLNSIFFSNLIYCITFHLHVISSETSKELTRIHLYVHTFMFYDYI